MFDATGSVTATGFSAHEQHLLLQAIAEAICNGQGSVLAADSASLEFSGPLRISVWVPESMIASGVIHITSSVNGLKVNYKLNLFMLRIGWLLGVVLFTAFVPLMAQGHRILLSVGAAPIACVLCLILYRLNASVLSNAFRHFLSQTVLPYPVTLPRGRR